MNTVKYFFRREKFFLTCLLIGGALLLGSAPLHAEKRLALIIGNSDYKVSQLANPINDANDMADKLEKLHFDVTLKTNIGKRDMKEAIREFTRQAPSYDVLLFYFAGHGVQANGENYLIPTDIDFDLDKAEIADEAVRAQTVIEMMNDANNKVNLFILDACRDNPFRGFSRGMSRGLAPIDGGTGTLIAFATGPGQAAADGNGRNGVYTEHLLKHIDEPGLTVEELFKKVRIEVLNATRNQQTPWENSSLSGDFCFVNCENPQALEATKKLTEENQKLLQQLELIKQQKQIADKLNAENARLQEQVTEFKRNYEAEKLANQERLQKLTDIQAEKARLETRLNTEQHSLATQKALQQQLEDLQTEKHLLEAKISTSEDNKRANAQIEASHAKKLAELQIQQSESASKLNQQNERLQAQLDEIKRTHEAEKRQLEAKLAAREIMHTKKVPQETNADLTTQLAEIERLKAENERLKAQPTTITAPRAPAPIASRTVPPRNFNMMVSP